MRKGAMGVMEVSKHGQTIVLIIICPWIAHQAYTECVHTLHGHTMSASDFALRKYVLPPTLLISNRYSSLLR